VKASQIEVGNTYWDGKKALRKVVDISQQGAETVVRYQLLCGQSNGCPLQKKHHDGSPLYGCYMRSFQRWAKAQVCFGPDALK
jgi:hypothetical protein